MAKMIKAKRNPYASKKKQVLGRRRPKVTASRTNATTVLAQGVGSVPRKPYGSVRVQRPTLACWDAKLPHHLSLPRAVGPYTTIRTTRRINTSRACMMFGTFMQPGGTGPSSGDWTSACAIGSVSENTAINGAAGNAYVYTTPLTFFGAGSSAATCVPSALTIQVLNPKPLQTTEGIIYSGVMNTQAAIGDRTETWSEFFDRFVNYQTPRLLSAAKLSLRGVQANSYPLNMTPVSEFTTLKQLADSTFIWDDSDLEPVGWAPIMVFNPKKVELEYLVTTEWRVRFDLANPASAGHTHHPIHSDNDWDRLMKQASSLGNGVMDIADVVSSVGEAAQVGGKVMQMMKAMPI